MKKTLTSLSACAILIASAAAHATGNPVPDCHKYSQHNCDTPKPTPSPTPTPTPASSINVETSQTQNTESSAAAIAAAKASADATANAKATGGNVTDNSKTMVNVEGAKITSDVEVKGSSLSISDNSTTNYRQVEVPVLFAPTPASYSPGGSMETRVTACGPRQKIVRKDVVGTHVGFWKQTSVPLGEDMELTPELDGKGNQVFYIEKKFTGGVTRLFGTQAIITKALPNVSAASSFSIGFASTNGGGNGGGGASSSMTRIVSNITLYDCELPGGYRLEAIAPKAAPPTVSKLTLDDIRGDINALAQLRFSVDVPVEKVSKVEKACVMQEYTDAKGVKVMMCEGPKGAYVVTKITKEVLNLKGNLESSAAATKK